MQNVDGAVLLLMFVPTYAYVLMKAPFHKPSRRDWMVFTVSSTAVVTAAIFLAVTGASGIGGLLFGAISGILAGLYEKSRGPEGSPGN